MTRTMVLVAVLVEQTDEPTRTYVDGAEVEEITRAKLKPLAKCGGKVLPFERKRTAGDSR